MNRPLSLKTVIVPAGQNKYGCDVVRFTADYVASDLFVACIGCYPPLQSNLHTIVIDSDDSDVERSSFHADARPSSYVDLRKETEGVCHSGNPCVKQESLLDKLGTSAVEPERVAHYWDV